MDYDGDGDIDVFSGSYTGEIYLFECGEDGRLATGRFLVGSDGKELKTGTSVTPEARDIDDDGDLDLVIGTRTDGVFTVENTGTRTKPVWAPTTKPLHTSKRVHIQGSNAHHADWDGDGTDDLVLGSEWGDVVWHRNTGTNTAPEYAPAQKLLDLRGKATSELQKGDTPTHPGARTKVYVTDWNGDGRADLLVGDVRWASYTLDPLTPEQEAEKAALKPVYEAGLAEENAIIREYQALQRANKPIPQELADRLEKFKREFPRVREQWYEFSRERTDTHGWVWLYLRTATPEAKEKTAPDGE